VSGSDLARIRVVVCCSHRLMRVGIKSILERESAIAVVAEASDRPELARAVRAHQPHVVVLEEGISAHLPDTVDSGGEIAADVVLLAEDTGPEALLALLRTDVRGLVHRDAPHDDLVCAVRAVATGDGFVSSDLTGALMQVVRAVLPRPRPRRSVARRDQLTFRESEVLDLICQGMANREIASALKLSEKTVKFHVSNLLAKMNMRTRAQLIAFAGAMSCEPRPYERPSAAGSTGTRRPPGR
jgi:DNA-binding NarL/FixJ family response regulator